MPVSQLLFLILLVMVIGAPCAHVLARFYFAPIAYSIYSRGRIVAGHSIMMMAIICHIIVIVCLASWLLLPFAVTLTSGKPLVCGGMLIAWHIIASLMRRRSSNMNKAMLLEWLQQATPYDWVRISGFMLIPMLAAILS